MTLIDKKRAPRLRDQASLAASGVPCPYWYARAGIISAIEAAECAAIEASDARRDHKAKVQQLRSLESVGEKFTSRTMEDLTKMVRAVKAIDAGVRLNPQALSSRVRGQGDELWDSFVESSNKFYDCVDRIEVACIPFEAILQRLLEIAPETRLSNNPPDVFRREFVEAIQGDFQLLTGLLEPSWGPVFLGFCAAAWDSAELQAELGGERLIKDLRKIT